MREDWIECEIGDVFDVVTGNTPSKANPLLYGGNIPFIKPPEINNKEVEDASEFLTEEGAKVARILPKYSVLITCIGNLGRVAMNSKFEVAFNQQINALKPNKFVYPKYIYYKAQSSNFRNQLEELSTAVTVSLVNKTNFSKVRFPLPPLPEQRAIVKKLESLFSSLDAGVANLKKAQQQLKIYRQAVLKKAFEGELTREWRIKEDKNFTVEDILNQIEEERKKFYDFQVIAWNQSVKDWENTGKKGKKNDKPTFNKIKISTTEKLLSGAYVHFGSICNVVRGGSPRPAGDLEFYDGNIPFLKVADLTRISSKYVTEYAYTIKPAGLQKTRFLKKGTLVISNSGATLGVARILGIDATANDGIAAFLDLHPEMAEFYYYYLNSQTENLRAIDQGAGQPNLNTDLLKELLVPIFSIEEQHQIVKEIESRLSVCDSIEQNIKESLEKAEALRQSILKKAFEGHLLTAQELAACKQAEDYEPASVLLERIKAEQNNTTAKPGKKKPSHSAAK